MFKARTLSISINRPYSEAYDFLKKPENFTQWADGLGKIEKAENGIWLAHTPDGALHVRFSEPNDFGILDHTVITPDGQQIYIPLRVIKNGEGVEVIFTLYHLLNMTFDKYEQDIKWVEKDLLALKTLLEDKTA